MKIFSEIIFQAINNNKPVGAFRLWFIAKDYDRGGSGFIPAKAFRQHIAKLGIVRPTFYRWLSQAFELGLIKRTRTNRGGQVYALVALDQGAMLAGVSSLLSPVKVDQNRFVSKGWLSIVWGAYIKHFDGRIISRATLERLTGVPARTQQSYEGRINVKRKGHIASFGDPSKDPDHAMAIDARRGIYGRAGMTFKRLPNSRIVRDENIQIANRGRTGKANKGLRALLNSRSSSPKPYYRLYFDSYPKLKRAIRGKQQDGNALSRPNTRYLFVKDAQGVGIWDAVNA